jgi:hypothetical protein
MRWFYYLRDPAGIRTQDPYIKSVMLYQLSYEIILFYFNLEFARLKGISVIEGTKVAGYEKYTTTLFKNSSTNCI